MHYVPAAILANRFLPVVGRGMAGVRSLDDGHLLWSRPHRVRGAGSWRGLWMLLDARIGFVDPANGPVVRDIFAANLHQAEALCGSIWLISSREAESSLVKAVDLESGVVLWERDVIGDMTPMLRQPATTNALSAVPGSIPGTFIATHGGSTFGCSLNDGSIAWHVLVPVQYAWPNVHEGRIYGRLLVATGDGTLLVFAPPVWKLT